jgi:VCBS repeat-containing protein
VNDGNGSTTTQDVLVTITGTNDAPDIAVAGTDSASATLTETNAGLTASGTLSVTDVDTTDTVGSTITGVTLSGTTGTLLAADVAGFLSAAPATGLAADAGSHHNLTWNFDSGTQAFNYLAVGQHLTLDYTVQASDGHGGTDTQQVSITINGTADGPVDILLTGVLPGADVPNGGPLGQFSAVGATGTVTYSLTSLVEKILPGGAVETDSTPDVSVTSAGVLNGTGGAPGVGFEDNRLYELGVTASDSGGSLLRYFRVATGGTGNDTIDLTGATSNDLAFAGAGGDTILAGDGNDTVFGQKDNDQIHGGDGNDTLWGMQGNNTFWFDTALNAATNVDRIMDFDPAHDLIRLSTAVFTAFSGSGTVAATAFGSVTSSGADIGTFTVGAGVRIAFDSSTGGLYYDVDGGSLANATEFAVVTLTGATSFTAADIQFGP